MFEQTAKMWYALGEVIVTGADSSTALATFILTVAFTVVFGNWIYKALRAIMNGNKK